MAIIPRIENSGHTPAWQTALRQAVCSVDELLRLLQIDAARLNTCPINREFPLRVPRCFIARMKQGDIQDPLLRQVLPLHEETRDTAGFHTDPLGEQDAMSTPGLLHKYNGRALLTLTGACAIHCRYCFRRHFPYSDANPVSAHWGKVLDYLHSHTGISEIILSGGDPLVLPDARLRELAQQLATIPQLRTLRIHTRLPIVLPDRVDEQLLDWLGNHPQHSVMVVHCNHPNEIDAAVSSAMKRLAQAGVTLLNQAVLLKGVNDNAATLASLSEGLFAAGVLPYYLHQLDKVQGAAHFEVDATTARKLMDSIHTLLPGYLVPRLVRELPGLPGKQLLWPGQTTAGP